MKGIYVVDLTAAQSERENPICAAGDHAKARQREQKELLNLNGL